jgi:membrane dipeptidase
MCLLYILRRLPVRCARDRQPGVIFGDVLSFMRRWIACRPDEYKLIVTDGNVETCKRTGELGIVFDIEGMCPVQDWLSPVEKFYELGVRWMLVAYNRNDAAGGGCLDDDGGLTTTERAIIDEIERVGIVAIIEPHRYKRAPIISRRCASDQPVRYQTFRR